MIGTAAVAHQHLQIAGVNDFRLLMHVSTNEFVHFRIEMGKAAIIRMMRHVRQPFAGDHHLR